jgi:ribosomal protein S18 acetylase RimI-like enzyme
MAATLQAIPFTADLLATVQAFDCGSEPWELEVSDWIKRPAGQDGAVDALARGTSVWLYVNDAGELVGFGSLAKTEQRWPAAKDPKVAASIIPWVAVDRRFWGQPPGPPEERYASQILDDLISKALLTRDERPLLVLYVHVNNQRAIAFYQRPYFGFVELHKPYTDRATGWQYKRMALMLKEPAA